MAGKVFVSCGQATKCERDAARSVARWLKGQGFVPYVATEVQTIPEINRIIISELKTADFFLFINFRREPLPSQGGQTSFRGSVYANQELAIAFALAFQHLLCFNQKDTRRDGIFGAMVSNCAEFDDYDDLLPCVQKAVKAAKWTPAFSRSLVLAWTGWGTPAATPQRIEVEPGTFRDVTLVPLLLDVYNRRNAEPAIDTIVICRPIEDYLRRQQVVSALEEEPLGATVVEHEFTRFESLDWDSPLKVAEQDSYKMTILPETHGMFELLAVTEEREFILLNAQRSQGRSRRIMRVPREAFRLTYQMYAQSFPALTFTVELKLRAWFTEPKLRVA